jgi:polyisoprenyl-phosphate glycosyltransferase
MKKFVSIVIPAYNEEANIPILYQKIVAILASYTYQHTYEIIFVDDGSLDRTWQTITDLAHKDRTVKGLKFSRNFGHQIALTAAYDAAHGDAIISMDADLQDPPELIALMLDAWHEGADIVYARRRNRKDGLLKKWTADLYYRLLARVSEITIARNVADFRLIDKKVLEQLNQCREKARYLRGMVAWTGFSCNFIDFERPHRFAGQTGYTWKKMFTLAFDGMTSFSTFPLRVVGYMGIVALSSVCVVVTYMSYHMIIYQAHYQLAAWLSLAGFFMMAVQSIALWLLGEYLARVYIESQARPLYIVARRCNISGDQKALS